jgi:hypothetical protein
MIKKEHQRNLRQISKAIEESNVLLNKAGKRLEDLEGQIHTNRKNFQSSKSKRRKLK